MLDDRNFCFVLSKIDHIHSVSSIRICDRIARFSISMVETIKIPGDSYGYFGETTLLASYDGKD